MLGYRKLLYCCLLIIFTGFIALLSAEKEWSVFSSIGDINVMVWDEHDNNVVWLGTDGGLVRYNVLSGEQIIYTKYNSGLNSNYITALVMGGDNELWIGTRNSGLLKYTGYDFQQYDSSNSNIPDNSRIVKLQFDENSDLWVATPGKVQIFSQSSTSQNSASHEGFLSSLGVVEMYVNSSVDVIYSYIGLYNNYSYHFDGEEHTQYNRFFWGIQKDSNNFYWATQSNRLAKFLDLDSEMIHYSSPVNGLKKIIIDHTGNIWCSSPSGLVKYNHDEWIVYNSDNSSLRCNRITALLEDRHQQGIWFGTSKDLVYFDGYELTFHQINNGLASHDVRDALISPDGNVWLATASGLTVYDEYSFVTYDSSNSPLPDLNINTMAIDQQDRIWLGTNNGLYCYSQGNWEHYTTENSFLTSNGIRLLEINNNNEMLIVNVAYDCYFGDLQDPHEFHGRDSPSSAFHLVDLETMSLIPEFSGVLDDFLAEVTAHIFSWHDGFLIVIRDWIAVGNGHVFFDTVYYYDDSGLSTSFLTDFLQDNSLMINTMIPKENGYWVTFSKNYIAGLPFYREAQHENPVFSAIYFENEEVVEYYNTENSSLSHGHVYSLLIEGNEMWMGSSHGLAHKQGEQWNIYNPENSPLPDRKIKKIFIDDDSRIWSVTRFGLAVYGLPLSNKDEQMTPTLKTYFNNIYPNPFNTSQSLNRSANLTLSFNLPDMMLTQIEVYNIRGQKIVTLLDKTLAAGNHTIYWDGKNDKGQSVPAGIYFCKIITGRFSEARKLLILR